MTIEARLASMPTMKHAGKAKQAGLRLVYASLALLLAALLGGMLLQLLSRFLPLLVAALAGVWAVFGLFCFYFFRDPDTRTPVEPGLYVAPAHGTVDTIDEVDEPSFVGGRCRRIGIFLSVLDVHVQRAPVAGQIAFSRHTPGQFLNAMRAESALYNENLLLGIESAERPGERIGVRLIAGLIARRIIPWVNLGEAVARGERISLIQFGSRVELLLPPDARVAVALRDPVRGGETVLARRD